MPEQAAPDGVYARVSRVWQGDIADLEAEDQKDIQLSQNKLSQYGAYEEGSASLEIEYNITAESNAMGLSVVTVFDRQGTAKFALNLPSVQGKGTICVPVQYLPKNTRRRKMGVPHVLDIVVDLYERKNTWTYKDCDYDKISDFPKVGRSVRSVPVIIGE
jgi:hypothetical protein